MIPFSFEAVVVAMSALGVHVWTGVMWRSGNMVAAVFSFWMSVICTITGILYLVRWVGLH